MLAGKLRHRLTLQRPVQTQDSTTGYLNTEWVTVKEIWGEIRYLSAREYIASQSAQSKTSCKIIIRYRQLDTTMRLLHDGKTTYNIEGILPDPKSGREYMTLMCSEATND